MRKEKVKSVLNRLSSFLCGVDSFSLVSFSRKKKNMEKAITTARRCSIMCLSVLAALPHASVDSTLSSSTFSSPFSVFPILLCLFLNTVNLFFTRFGIIVSRNVVKFDTILCVLFYAILTPKLCCHRLIATILCAHCWRRFVMKTLFVVIVVSVRVFIGLKLSAKMKPFSLSTHYSAQKSTSQQNSLP